MSEDNWTPVTLIADSRCYFCHWNIPRGTVAFSEPVAMLTQCRVCMAEHTRAELARKGVA